MKTLTKRFSTIFGVALLAAATAFFSSSCGDDPNPGGDPDDIDPRDIDYRVEQVGGIDGTKDTESIRLVFDSPLPNSIGTKNLALGNGISVKYSASSQGNIFNIQVNVSAPGLATVSLNEYGIVKDTKEVLVHKAGTATPEYCSVLWEFNGGMAGTGAKHPSKTQKNAALAKPNPDPVRSGNYSFGGWHTDSALTQAYDFTSLVTANVTLYAKWVTGALPPSEITVPGGTLAAKLQWIKSNAQSNTTYFVEIDADEEIAPQNLSYAGKNNITVRLSGNVEERTVSLSEDGSLFSISGITLILDENITLQGRNNNNAPLVTVGVYYPDSGTLIMNSGSKITGNENCKTNNQKQGGGVFVSSNTTFTMNGGEISNNAIDNPAYAVQGGGIYLEFKATFTMNNGKISNNTTNSGGSGIYLYSDSSNPSQNAIFTMNGGEISNNSRDGVRGSFTMNGGKIFGNEGYGVSGYLTLQDGEISGNSKGGVSGGITMHGGKIFGNSGPGVEIGNDSSMLDGEIYGNTANNGGGVIITEANFTMNGGKIYNNTANSGGGVYINAPGVFDMRNGEISGNTASATYGGGGVFFYYSTGYNGARSGVFYKTGGIIYGYSEDDTVNSNTVKDSNNNPVNNMGHAIHYFNAYSSSFGSISRRETTAGPDLTFEVHLNSNEGEWEN